MRTNTSSSSANDYELATLSTSSVDNYTDDNLPRGLYSAAAGNIELIKLDGTAVVVAVVAGMRLDLRFRRINTTLTTVAAANILVCF